MTTGKIKESDVEQDKHDMKPSVSARRRLIRGAFAAPAAMTLFSGSVAARSAINCVTKQVTNVELPLLANEAGSSYVRVQLQRFNGMVGATTLTNRTSRWIRGSDVVAQQAAGSSVYLNNTQWQLYDRDTTGATSSCLLSGTTPFNPASAYAGITPGTVAGTISTQPSEGGVVNCTGGSVAVTSSGPFGDQWVAIRIDGLGNIQGVVGINNPATGQSAVWQSCWSSFRLG
jgi:hypothetical protein